MDYTLNNGVLTVTLSRTNLQSLLFKLDEPTSARTLIRNVEDLILIVRAEEDEDHYQDRQRGIMHPREEAKLNAT